MNLDVDVVVNKQSVELIYESVWLFCISGENLDNNWRPCQDWRKQIKIVRITTGWGIIAGISNI